MNSQDLPTKDGPLTVNEQVPVSFLFQPKSQRFAPVAVHALASLRLQQILPRKLTEFSASFLIASHINSCCLMLLMFIFI